MFGWLFGKKDVKQLEEDTKKSFSAVKDDVDKVGKWLKHLDGQDKQLFETISEIKKELSTIKHEISALKEENALGVLPAKNKRLFGKTAVLDKQTAVYAVQEGVQTAVQTGSFYDILKGLTSNERMLVFAIMNAGEGMKLSYEDLAMLLGKERATIRGQINAIKQKSEGLIEEMSEKNGKKRVFVRAEIREKLLKYAKVRVGKSKKAKKNEEIEVKSEE